MRYMAGGQLQRSSLGRLGFVGELYDARCESLTSRSLLKRPFPSNLVQTTDMNQTEFEFKFIENHSDRFELFKVQGELQVAVLLGLVKIEGSAQFLTDTTNSEGCVSCSLIYRVQTVNEKLIASSEEILPFLDLNALQDPRFTHVVIEIIWGANCLLSLEHSCNSKADKEEIKGRLEGELSFTKATSLKGQGKVENAQTNSAQQNYLDVKVRADVIPKEGLPTSVDAFRRFVEEIPNLLKNVNGGKGKPLSYVMIPLSTIRSLAKLESAVQVEVTKIDFSFVTSLVYFFDDVARIKQKIHDLVKLLNESKKYVPEETLYEVRNKEQEISVKESELKDLISGDWVRVKSGEQNLRDLVRKVEQFKSRSFNLISYEDFLDSCSSVTKKLSQVKHFTSRGVVYLGRGEKLDELQRNHHSSDFFVMLTSSKLAEADPELNSNTCCLFLTLIESRAPNTVYAVVDFDYGEKHFLKLNVDKVKLVHLKETKILCRDLWADYLEAVKTNYARRKSQSGRQLCKHKPGNRVPVKIPCPGYLIGSCSETVLEWKCLSCNNNLEYGFDDHYYCSCGKEAANSFEYRCNQTEHGTAFISASSDFLQKTLSQLRPLEEMNLLLIGQSGVGKSTWINSILNYLSYETLEDAKRGGTIVKIPMQFQMDDPETFERRVIKVGEESDNEVTVAGQSATQFSRTYCFTYEDRCVRLIDTPGLGDVRGIQRDKDNMKNLIDHISHLKELHGVCILIKANDNKMHTLFTYCVKELLVHLHKSIAKNIVFCFTNARNSLYTPGVASVLVSKIIDGLEVKQHLALGKHNQFCLDNEAFLYLCAIENGMTFDKDIAQSFEKSWTVSLNETKRLFRTVLNFEAHELKETVSLIGARMRVLTLTKPLAEVNKTIQVNLETIKRKQNELNDKNLTVEELSKKLTLVEVRLEPVTLSRPRTVCTSRECVEYLTYSSSGVQEIDYKTHCHEECYLTNVNPKTINNAALKSCEAMNFWGNCKKCGCSWANHMHLTYSQKRVEEVVTNKSVETKWEKEKTEKEQIEIFMKDLSLKLTELEMEKKFITKATAKFAVFLKQNAITVYNDSLEEYLLLLIEEEQNKPHKSQQELKLLENLKANLQQYREEVNILTEAIHRGEGDSELTGDDIYELEKELYSLKHTGNIIKDFAVVSRNSVQNTANYTQEQVSLKSGKNKESKRFWDKNVLVENGIKLYNNIKNRCKS